MKEKMLISIIIPVYNGEGRIKKCVESLMPQITDDMEVIIINDGSCDGTKRVCEYLSNSYPNLKVLNQKNSGVSNARNKGIDCASGEFLLFLDDDDEYHIKDIMSYILVMQNEGADIGVFGIIKKIGSRHIDCRALFDEEYRVYSGENLSRLTRWVIDRNPVLVKELPCSDDKGNELEYAFRIGSPCSKIFRKSSIGTIRFDDMLSISEDLIFVYDVFRKCSKVIIFRDSIYSYSIVQGSVTNSNFLKNGQRAYYELGRAFYNRIDDYDDLFKNAIKKRIIECAWRGIKTGICSNKQLGWKDKLIAVRKYISLDIYKFAACNVKNYNNMVDYIKYCLIRFKLYALIVLINGE